MRHALIFVVVCGLLAAGTVVAQQVPAPDLIASTSTPAAAGVSGMQDPLPLGDAAAHQPAAAGTPVPAADKSVSVSVPARTTDDAAWKQALTSLLGVTPEQVRAYKKGEMEIDKAAAPRAAVKEARSDAIPVSLSPGSPSPRVVLMHGYVTSLEILDATGQPWPIVDERTGDKNAVDAKIEGAHVLDSGGNIGGVAAKAAPPTGPTSFGNVVTINPLTRFTATNMQIVLQGLSRPVDVVLVAQEASDSTVMTDRITLLVQGNGPLARAENVPNYDSIDAGDDLRRALVGQPPTSNSAEILAELPAGMRAWTDGSQLWVRTSSRVLSPAPEAAVAMGEVHAYRLTYLPVIVVANNGRMENVNVPKAGPIADER